MKNSHPLHPLAEVFPKMEATEFAELKKSIAEAGLRHKIVLLNGQILDGRHRDAACLELKIPPIFREYDPAIDGDALVSFVADENLNRRSLTVGQRAAVAVELEPYFADLIVKRKNAEKAAKDAKKQAKKDAAEALAKGMTTNLQEGAPDQPPANVVIPEYDQEPGDGDGEGIAYESGQTAAGQAATAVGVSKRTVNDAKDLKKTAPDEFKKVQAGEKSVHQAKQDAKALGEQISPYRAECADLVEANHGEEFSQAIRNVTILKTSIELDNFMKTPVPEQKAIVPFVVKGWKVDDAIKFMRGEFSAGSTVGELMSFANAKGGSVEVTVGEFKFQISKA